MDKLKSILFSQTTRDTLISFTGLGTIAVVGMIFTIITARGLGPSLFGLFSSLNAIVTLLSSMGDLGISAALVNFLPKVTDRRQTLISATFWFQIVISAILTLVLISTSLVHGLIVPGSSIPHFIIIAFLTGFYVLQGFALGIFNAEKKFFQASFIQGFDSTIKLAIVAGLFYTKNLNVELALLANVLSCFLSLIYGFAGEFKNIRPIFPRAQLTEVFAFSKWIALSRFFSVMISRVDILLLNLMIGGFEAGIFAAASRITLLFALLVSSLGSVTSPRFSAFRHHHEIIAYLKKVSLMVVGVSIFMLFTMLIADPLVRTVFGTKFVASIPIFQALTVAMIPFLFTVVTVPPLIYSFNQPQFLAKITIIQTVVLVGLDILLIPTYHAFGPAISLAVSNVIVFGASAFKLFSLLRTPQPVLVRKET